MNVVLGRPVLAPLLMLLAAPAAPAAPAAVPAAVVDFVRDVKPILDAACVSCHGAEKRKAELRLDSKQAALTGGLSGPALVPGKSAESLLLKRILGQGGEDRMPLKAPPLTAPQIDLVRRWLDQGAAWPEEAGAGKAAAGTGHWAHVKPARPAVPAVERKAWVRNPIDAFVLARLEKEGLAPSPEADRETLLRRVSLDLVGLPPSLTEIDAFKADRSPAAYQKVVERLLASPHHGERWARPWLDLARYADSHGYEKDGLRVAWKWRDWVIDALNQNLSFKQFTIEQIAGDMLPGATVSQRIATGFHRNTLLNQEGGVDDEEARWETLVDRVSTTATTWLGSTLGCAQCHNHKFDPFSQKDFYRFLAFFDNGAFTIRGQHPESFVVEPEIELPTPEQKAARDGLRAEIAALEKQMSAANPEVQAGMRAWQESVRAADRDWRALEVSRAVSRGGASLRIERDGSVLAGGPNPEADRYEIEARAPAGKVTGVRLEVLGHASLPAGGPGRSRDGNFFLTAFELRVLPPGAPSDDEGQEVELAAAVSDEQIAGHRIETLLKEGETVGWAIDPEMKPRPARRQGIFVLAKPLALAAGARLRVVLEHDMPRTTRNLGRFRLSVTGAEDPTLAALLPTRVRPGDRAEIERIYLRVAPALESTRSRIVELRKRIDKLGVVSAMVLEERHGFERPSTHLRVRGSFTNKGEQVFAGTPKALPPLTESQPPNRLGLARWLVDDENPLTARVTVNRLWSEYFGRGIVETTEDLGTQSPPPTHPELLDWLATELVRTGWDLKAMHRLIVTSATYRQSSSVMGTLRGSPCPPAMKPAGHSPSGLDACVTPALKDKDPYNKLYARGPRFRLDAETIRDVALAASGLLARKVGGPSVHPVQPDGIWDRPYSGIKWKTSEGQDRHRRGLYTFLRRTSPYPSLITFDGPSREICTARRTRTNTPLQALTTLNDPVFVEAAQALARRMVRESPADPATRAAHGFRLATGRTPRREEVAPIVAYQRAEAARLRGDREAARKLVGGDQGAQAARLGKTIDLAELAAWTLAANVLLNLDETITKE